MTRRSCSEAAAPVSEARSFAPCRALGIQRKVARHASGSPSGATATTAASGGNREELLGQRPAGCKRQRSRRWVPQPGLWHRKAMTERARTLTENHKRSDGIALTKSLLIAVWRLLAENRAPLDKKRTAGFLDSRPAMRYNIHRKGTVTNGLASF